MRSIVFLLSLFLLSSLTVRAQVQVVPIDLAKKEEAEVYVQPGVRIVFQIINKLPEGKYRAAGEVRSVKIPELTGFAPLGASDCSDWMTAINSQVIDLKGITVESEIPAIVTKLEKLRTDTKECTDEDITKKGSLIIDQAIASTRGELEYGRILESGTELHLIVSRTDPDNHSWERVFTTGPSGEWITQYGLMALWKSDAEYAVRDDDSTDTLFIRKVERDEEWDCVTGAPVVVWHWMPQYGWHKGINWSLVGGVGWYDDKPLVLAGFGLNYKANVGIALAGLIRPKHVLNGRYIENQQVEEFLDWDQLSQWKASLGIGIALTLRLGSNPFADKKVEVAGKSKEEEKEGKESDTDG